MDSGMKAIVPLGDQAALLAFTTEAAALDFAARMHNVREPWLEDVVASYHTVAVFFDLGQIAFAEVADWLRARLARSLQQGAAPPGRLHRIPCCYDFALDLERIHEHTGLTPEEIIQLHAETEYTVYAIGFCPGFPYLGYLPPRLCNVPRLPSPRLRVEAGSVGLTGRQTGIYTEARPAGWNLVGRTPLVLVDVADGYFPLRAGDRVRFERIDMIEFQRRQGQRLE
jgi:inhibitor of KinA